MAGTPLDGRLEGAKARFSGATGASEALQVAHDTQGLTGAEVGSSQHSSAASPRCKSAIYSGDGGQDRQEQNLNY